MIRTTPEFTLRRLSVACPLQNIGLPPYCACPQYKQKRVPGDPLDRLIDRVRSVWRAPVHLPLQAGDSCLMHLDKVR
jgi:hypothetical protein